MGVDMSSLQKPTKLPDQTLRVQAQEKDGLIYLGVPRGTREVGYRVAGVSLYILLGSVFSFVGLPAPVGAVLVVILVFLWFALIQIAALYQLRLRIVGNRACIWGPFLHRKSPRLIDLEGVESITAGKLFLSIHYADRTKRHYIHPGLFRGDSPAVHLGNRLLSHLGKLPPYLEQNEL